MKFVGIVPPEAGKLDQHRAVVALELWELNRLRTAVKKWAAVKHLADLGLADRPDETLMDGLGSAGDWLAAAIDQAAVPAGEDA